MTTTSSIYCPPASFCRPSGKLGIVYGASLYIFAVRDPRPELLPIAETIVPLGDDVADSEHLVTLLKQHSCRTCWLLPVAKMPTPGDAPLVAGFERTDFYDLNMRDATRLYQPLTGQHNRLVGATVKQLDRGSPIGQPYMIYASWANTFNTEGVFSIEGESRVNVLAGALLLASFTLNIHLRYSASWSGQCILREELQSWVKELEGFPTLSEKALDLLDQYHARWLLWTRPVDEHEYQGVIYQYDRNWSFVSSAREVPVGNPTRTSVYEPSLHGFYRLDASAPDGWSTKWPGVFIDKEGNYPLRVSNGVAWNPQVALAMKLGWKVNVKDGFVWQKQQKHDLFRSWQERLWKARRECETLKATMKGYSQHIAAIAVKIIKLIGVSAIGKLMQSTSNYLMDTDVAVAQGKEIVSIERSRNFQLTGRAQVREERSSDLYQPGWWSAIISRQTERIQSALYGIAGDATMGCYIDCLYCVRPVEGLDGDKLKTGGFRLADISHPHLNKSMSLSPKALATLHKQSKEIPQWEAA